MPTRRRSERSRWVTVFGLSEPNKSNADDFARQEHAKAIVIVRAFERVGRVVRVEVDGNRLEFKARKA
jgi:hypothetical protein